MTGRSSKPPEALMRVIAQDLRPVKPSPRPLHLAFEVAPFALLISAVVLAAMGIRADSSVLGPLLTWGASSAQFLLAIVLVWMAAHESTPAGRLPKWTVYAGATAALLVVVAITMSTFWISPVGSTFRLTRALPVPPWIVDLVCGVGSTVAGGVLVLLFSWMFRNSLAIRPTVAGALYGAGAGLAINAGWRIACPVSRLGHTLGAHGAAIVATVVLGALIGRFLGNRRWQIGGKRP